MPLKKYNNNKVVNKRILQKMGKINYKLILETKNKMMLKNIIIILIVHAVAQYIVKHGVIFKHENSLLASHDARKIFMKLDPKTFETLFQQVTRLERNTNEPKESTNFWWNILLAVCFVFATSLTIRTLLTFNYGKILILRRREPREEHGETAEMQRLNPEPHENI